ncbi:3-deoxy-D-manno-octulosonic acid transferase [Sulfurivermis fontis]|uniref:3-deoxy-D-manno-octulosonic acid transferase n=1 Tax=Sulfurivermis fontis TaxID=1972068 RepID=UPI000FD95371|nr:3-deoxy-D-manno-octulosonic acid transferase [Sulfurivermis fontis]
MTSPALTRYRLLFNLLTPLLLGYTLWQALRERSWRYLRERCGHYRGNPMEASPLWLHAASVGELNAALPLIDALRNRHPEQALLITTTTLSSARLAMRLLPAGVSHAFLPLDWSGAVGRFLDHYRPRCALIMETELWPNLFAACAARRLPLIIVNGRLSLRTRNAPRWLCRLYRSALGSVTAILARSEADKAGFIALGAPAERVRVIGNIKFSAETQKTATNIPLPRPYVLAASTRDGEETLVWRAWRQAAPENHLLVIVPRHPQRLPEILRDLALPPGQIAVRSRAQTILPATRVYIADTFGELTGFMAGAELVFMGGSLVPRGGQNVLEAARLGKALVFGPHMENFADEARLLLEHDGAVQVQDADALGQVFSALLAQPERRAALGAAAQQLVERRRDMAQRYAVALEEWCEA